MLVDIEQIWCSNNYGCLVWPEWWLPLVHILLRLELSQSRKAAAWRDICQKYLKASVLATASRGRDNSWHTVYIPKSLGRKDGEWDSLGIRALKTQIRRYLEGHTHAQGRAYALKRSEKALCVYLWLTFMFCRSRKWRLRQSRNLPSVGWEAYPNTHMHTHLHRPGVFCVFSSGHSRKSVESLC